MPKTANIYVTREIPDGGLLLLRKAFGNFEMNKEDRVLSREELMKAVRGRDGVLCLLTDTIDAAVIDAAGPQCKIFSNYAVGFNNIDVEEASRRNIMVTNTPGVLTDATADLAIALIFAASRRVVEADGFARAGKFKGWGPMLFLGRDITGKTLGIIGAGRIGGNVARKMAKGFRMKILYTDMNEDPDLEREIGAVRVDLPKLLAQSDFISVHISLNEQTCHMIGKKEFLDMKPDCVFINTSRGPVVDEAALLQALLDKKIWAAGLDVYEREPEILAGLTKLPNVTLLPHVASATFWTRTQMAVMAAQNLIDALNGRLPEFCVNKEKLLKTS